MNEAAQYSIFGWVVDSAIVAALIGATATIIAGLIISWLAAKWQKRQFNEQRDCSWTDNQLTELYGPLLALIHVYVHEHNSLIASANNIFNKDRFTLGAKPKSQIVVSRSMPDEQLKWLEEGQHYTDRTYPICSRLYGSMHELVMKHYELLEVHTRDRMPALHTALRLYQDFDENLIDAESLEEFMDSMGIDRGLDALFADVEVTTMTLVCKRRGFMPTPLPLSRPKYPDTNE